MGSLKITAAGVNNMGRVRKNNEDSLLFNGQFMKQKLMNNGFRQSVTCHDDRQTYAVCDGMGGMDAGEVASFMAVSALQQAEKDGSLYDRDLLVSKIRDISDAVGRYSMDNRVQSGTTLAMVTFDHSYARVSNVGDSRVYMMRGGTVKQASVDHSEVQRMIDMGMLTPEQAATYPRRHVITQFVGMVGEATIAPTVSADIKLMPGDVFMICSDGLNDMVGDADISDIMQKNKDPMICAETLLNTALERGGVDNTTIIVVKVEAVSDGSASSSSKRAPADINKMLTVLQIGLGIAAAVALIDTILKLIGSK